MSSVTAAAPRERVGEVENDNDSDDRGAKSAAASSPPQSQAAALSSPPIRISSAAMAVLTQMQEG
jgi:hypothetical protein